MAITHTAVTREELGRAVRRAPDVRLRERSHCILRLRDGKSCPEIAQWWYRDEETVRSWVHAFNEAGLRGPERAPAPGRPTCLTTEQMAQRKEAVHHCPRAVGDNMSLWTTNLVWHVSSTRVGVEFGRARARQLLHALGVRLRRLRHRHWRATAEAQAAFAAALGELLADWPEEEWPPLFVDAATGRRHPPLTAQWCVTDDVPDVPTGADHGTRQVDGAVAPLTGRPHDHISPALGNGEFVKFRPHLLIDYPGKRLPVLHERGPQHTGALVEEAARAAGGRLVLPAQPAYSPELHPQERIWTWWRRAVTHNHWFATLAEPIEARRDCFRYLAGVKDQGQRVCGLKTPDSLVASL